MGERRPKVVADFVRRSAFPLFVLVFGLFCANVLAGKLFVVTGWDRTWLAGDLLEFLLLALSAILLMFAALAREAGENQPTAHNDNPREENDEKK